MSTVNQLAQNTYIASGNIRPARILIPSQTVVRSAAEAGAATTRPIGVSLNGYKFTNSIYDGSVYAYTAVANDPIPYAGPGSVALVLVGATSVTDLRLPVGATTDGACIPLTPIAGAGTVNYTIGYPLQTGVAGDLILVAVNPEQITV